MNRNTIKATAFAGLFFTLTACTKVVDGTDDSVSAVHAQTTNAPAIASPIIHFFETPFFTQINTTTVTESNVLVFDFTDQKTFTAGKKGSLLLPFGDGQFYDRGWKYQVSFDTVTYAVFISPNDTMTAAIIPGSFKVEMATFDAASKTFNFITRFRELNGNKSEVAETVFKRWR